MSDRPIIFPAPMVRALLAGRKTQDRRVLKPQPHGGPLPSDHLEEQAIRDWIDVSSGYEWAMVRRLPYAPCDRLWVREAVRFDAEWDEFKPTDFDRADAIHYEADGHQETRAWGDPFTLGNLRPSTHMPRWASRLTLTVTDVRVQRLQDISEEDAKAEGAKEGDWPDRPDCSCDDEDCVACSHYPALCKPAFRHIWNTLHGADAWDANPWVVALTFTVQRGNIDQVTP